MRLDVNTRALEFAEQLRSSPELAAKADALKAELLDHPEVRAWSASLWQTIKSALLEAAEDPESNLRQRLQLELQVGKDLQYIRINGTLVGGIAGLVIYSLSQLLL